MSGQAKTDAGGVMLVSGWHTEEPPKDGAK